MRATAAAAERASRVRRVRHHLQPGALPRTSARVELPDPAPSRGAGSRLLSGCFSLIFTRGRLALLTAVGLCGVKEFVSKG